MYWGNCVSLMTPPLHLERVRPHRRQNSIFSSFCLQSEEGLENKLGEKMRFSSYLRQFKHVWSKMFNAVCKKPIFKFGERESLGKAGWVEVLTILPEKALVSCSRREYTRLIHYNIIANVINHVISKAIIVIASIIIINTFQWKLLYLESFEPYLHRSSKCGHMAVKIKPPRTSVVKDHFKVYCKLTHHRHKRTTVNPQSMII